MRSYHVSFYNSTNDIAICPDCGMEVEPMSPHICPGTDDKLDIIINRLIAIDEKLDCINRRGRVVIKSVK